MYGIIDVGSNTIRLSIYKYINDDIKLMLTKKNMVGLAGYVNKEGYLTSKGIEKAVDALLEFKETLDNIEVKETFVFATASLRNIKNSQETTEYIGMKTGFSVRILSGTEEATYDYIGAAMRLSLDNGLLIDIGGGSTELVLYENGAIKNTKSMPIGSLSLFNKCVKGFLPTEKEIKSIEKKVLKKLKNTKEIPTQKKEIVICGVGGTVRATCKLKNEIFDLPKTSRVILVNDMKRIITYYKKKQYDFITYLIKVTPDRLHTILPGMIILYTIAKYFNSEKIIVSEFGIREGYLYQMIKDRSHSNEQSQ